MDDSNLINVFTRTKPQTYLAKERVRLGYSAQEVADLVGISVACQSNYENGKTHPNRVYLRKICELGFDIEYIINGRYSGQTLTDTEKDILTMYRESPKSVRNMVLSGLKGVQRTEHE